jgi:hypothetical protein
MKKMTAILVRLFGWLLFLFSLLFTIAFFFLSIEKDIPTNERTETIIGIVIFGALAFLGFRLTRFRKKQENLSLGAQKEHTPQDKTAETNHKKSEAINDDIAELAYNATLKEREKRKQVSRNITFMKGAFKPLLELCSEIENDTENNYIPFDPPIPAEIVYCDKDGTITTRKIDVRYIAKSDYNDDYYFKAYCHLRNEDRSFNVERIQKTIVDENEVDFIQYIVDTYRNTDKYKETILSIKTRNLINSNDTIGYSAKILTYIARIDGIFTRKEKTVIADFIKNLAADHTEIEIENYIDELSELKPSTAEYKALVKNANISNELIEKARGITGNDPLRQGAFQILFKQYQKNNLQPKVK